MPVTGFSNLSVLHYTYVLEEGDIRLRHQVSLKSADHAMTAAVSQTSLSWRRPKSRKSQVRGGKELGIADQS
jgi:hypothetical protein